MARDPIPTWFFALVVVRKGDRFLLVEEKDGEWFLPAGRVEMGERITDAAIRETLEEAGVAVTLEGILRIEHSPRKDGARLRVFFVARPSDDRPPKSVPDSESRGARWFTLGEARGLRLRSTEVVEKLERLARGEPVAPISILASLAERG
jgi:ADP-ribose pyrophosphatase YjhB (NUDIX family)